MSTPSARKTSASFPAVLLGLFAAAGTLLGQETSDPPDKEPLSSEVAQAPKPEPVPAPSVLPAPPVTAPTDATASAFAASTAEPAGPSLWGSADFLLWRIKDGPLPVPLVTTG